MTIIGLVLTVAGMIAGFASSVFFFSGFVHIVLSIYCAPFIKPLTSKRDMIQLDYKKSKNDTDNTSQCLVLSEKCDAAEDELYLMKSRLEYHKAEYLGCFKKGIGLAVLAAVILSFGASFASYSSYQGTLSTLNNLGYGY